MTKVKPCSIIGCNKPAFCKGYCRKHYYNYNTHGDPLYKKVDKKCSECNQKHYAKGLCKEHYFKAKATVGGIDLGGKRCSVDGCDNPHYGKGFCRQHWNRMTHAGTLESKKVHDLPGEEWKEIDKPDCKGVLVSNMGRLKSVRRRDEVLLTTKMRKINPRETLESLHGPFNIHVHMEVLRAFHSNKHGDFQAVFLDGDRSNCRADNLTWYGQKYLVVKAIEMAENSNHPLADCFLKFWHGETNILNDWFEEQRKRLRGFLFNRLDRFMVPFYVDVDDVLQETIVKAFLSLRRGMVKSLDTINSWMYEIAKKTLAEGVRDVLPGVAMIRSGDDGSDYSCLDYAGFCHPSAEIQAIYNQEAAI